MRPQTSVPKYRVSFSKGLAEWVIRVKKVAPDAPSKIVFFLALIYHAIGQDDMRRVEALDGYLAFTPWKEDRKYLRLYKRAVSLKFVPKVEMWSFFVEELFETNYVDPRFTGSADEVREFENDIYEK